MFKRYILSLLYNDNAFYKTVNFKEAKYIGDPLNIVNIFNDKEVDEAIVFNIARAKIPLHKDSSLLSNLRKLVSESFFPIAYGGGVSGIEDVQSILRIGFDRVVINSLLVTSPETVIEISNKFGQSTVVGCIDYKRSVLGKRNVMIDGGRIKAGISLDRHITKCNDLGLGELILQSIDRDGTMNGYDLDIISEYSSKLTIPLVPMGGAGSYDDIYNSFKSGASASAASSLFIYNGKYKAVLPSYINFRERKY